MSRTPTPYTRQTNFTSFEASNPSKPKPGASLDAEFNAVRTALDATQSRLAEIQRDDGQLANLSVHPDALNKDVRALLAAGAVEPRGNWAPGATYRPKDMVMHGGGSYLAAVAHTSGTDFDTDLAAGKWFVISPGPPDAADVTYDNTTSGLAATNLQVAIDEVAESAASAALAEVIAVFGYLPPVSFASGLNVDSIRFTVTYDGVTYAPVSDAIPFTTTGTFDPGQWRLVQGLTAAELASDSGVAMVSGKLSGDSQKRQLIDILSKDIMFSISNAIPLAHTGDVRSYAQAALNEAASTGRAGRREVVFRARGEYEISNFLAVPSGVRLIFDGDSRFKPTSSFSALGTADGLRSYGTIPAGGYPPSSDIIFGAYKIPAGIYASLFAAGDYVWLGSSLVIATSPNTQGVTRAQMAKVIAVDGSDLILDRMIEYDFPAATSTFGKADIVSGVRVENFVWGDPSMGIVSGRGIDFRFHDDLRIIGSDIGWSRDTPQLGSAYDKQNVNAINLSCCSNVEIDGLKTNRVGWYGVSLNGACHNVRVRGLDARMVRHGLSLNWNGPGEPINVTVEDSEASLTTFAGFDTHDVGRDITFRKVRVTGSNGPGIQVRTSNVTVDDASVDGCAGAGFLVYGEDEAALSNLFNVTLSKIRARSCTNGVLSLVGVKIQDASISNCSVAGISTNGGSINVARIVNSNVAIMYRPGAASDSNMVPLTVRDVDAPASANQTYFLRSTKAFTDQDLKLRDVRAVGYDADKIVSRTTSAYIADIDHRGCTFGTDPRQGTVALVGGTATIMNNNIVVPASPTLTRVFRSNVDVQRLVDGGTVGSYTVTLSTGQIVITSSSNTDTSTLSWRIV